MKTNIGIQRSVTTNLAAKETVNVNIQKARAQLFKTIDVVS